MVPSVREQLEDLLISMCKPHPPHSPCYIDSLPPEVISEILAIACDNAGDTVGLKWKFPAVANRVSRRFYHIAMQAHALWRYIYIHNPPYPYDHINGRIARGHTLPFVADVFCLSGSDRFGGEVLNEETHWKKIIKVITPILPRLSSLTFYSLFDNDPILTLLNHDMPMLETLHVEGYVNDGKPLPKYNLSPDQFPALRTLRSRGLFHWENGYKLPGTVEELYLDMDREYEIQPSEDFWDFLPARLRTLKIEHLTCEGIDPPRNGKPRLPCLTELSFLECNGTRELDIIQHLDGSCLKTLSICVNDMFSEDMCDLSSALELPVLAHFTLESRTVPRLTTFLQQCSSLTSIHLNTFQPSESVSELVESLANDPGLLSNLKDLKVFGTPVFSLRRVVQGRPGFKRIEVHILELGMKPLATREEFREWEECVDWLDCHVELVGNRVGCSGVGFPKTEFYKDNLPRYRSWEDMMAGRTVDIPDWRGIEDADRQFWSNHNSERLLEIGRLADSLKDAPEELMGMWWSNAGFILQSLRHALGSTVPSRSEFGPKIYQLSPVYTPRDCCQLPADFNFSFRVILYALLYTM